MASGSPRGELPFDPIVVREHFFKAQAALSRYAGGTTPFTTWGDGLSALRPSPLDAEYGPFIDALAARFAAAFLRGEQLVIGSVGDSTLAGADNCYYDNWISTLERQLKPLFAAGKVALSTRNCGHNGGFGAFDQLVCAESMVGEDVDIVLAHFPFVTPREVTEQTAYELFLRRALGSGIIPHVSSALDGNVGRGDPPSLFEYAKYGVGFGPRSFGVYNEENGSQTHWFPNAKNGGWGRVGDGSCHADLTRSGSPAVLSRNWHPGPIGHQVRADVISFLYMTAAGQALTLIDEDLKVSGAKLAPLLLKFRGRAAVKDAVKTWPTPPVNCRAGSICTRISTTSYARSRASMNLTRVPGCASLCAADGSDQIFPKCILPYGPFYGRNWSDWLVADQSPG
jgi:hypothetical protein